MCVCVCVCVCMYMYMCGFPQYCELSLMSDLN